MQVVCFGFMFTVHTRLTPCWELKGGTSIFYNLNVYLVWPDLQDPYKHFQNKLLETVAFTDTDYIVPLYCAFDYFDVTDKITVHL